MNRLRHGGRRFHVHGRTKFHARKAWVSETVQGKHRWTAIAWLCSFCGFNPNERSAGDHEQAIAVVLKQRRGDKPSSIRRP